MKFSIKQNKRMLFKIIIHEALCSFGSAKKRTALALIGIIIGIGAVVATDTIGKIVQVETAKRFTEMGTDLLYIELGVKSVGFVGSIKDLLTVPKNCPSISGIAPYLMRMGFNEGYLRGKIIESIDVIGVTQMLSEIGKFKLREGRMLSDLDTYSEYCYIGSEISDELNNNGNDNLLGQKIKIGKFIFTIVGIIESKPEGGLLQFNANRSIFIHLTSAEKINIKGFYNAIARITFGASVQEAKTQLQVYLEKIVKANSINITSPEELISVLDEQKKGLVYWGGSIGLITLCLGAISIMNVMLMSIDQRKQEIGIRRALGAKKKHILIQFLLEAMLLTLIGGGIGIIFGVGAGLVFSGIRQLQFIFSYSSVLSAALCSGITGLLSGFYPAFKAAQLEPIVAIRSN